jgi:hypothetical protein
MNKRIKFLKFLKHVINYLSGICVVYTNAELDVHNVFWTMHVTCYYDHVPYNPTIFNEKTISLN